jgi:hypothetical protein
MNGVVFTRLNMCIIRRMTARYGHLAAERHTGTHQFGCSYVLLLGFSLQGLFFSAGFEQ